VPPSNAATQDQALLLWSLKLEKHLASERAYLDPELNLTQLAKQLKTNSSQLSKVINTVHGQNFNDFINELRCAAFMQALEAGEHRIRTLLSLALDSGFNSKATFNRAFKKCYGISPGEAAKRIDTTE
jgi:AraC-like DNA-binding protein